MRKHNIKWLFCKLRTQSTVLALQVEFFSSYIGAKDYCLLLDAPCGMRDSENPMTTFMSVHTPMH
jgi:hypothetical protein